MSDALRAARAAWGTDFAVPDDLRRYRGRRVGLTGPDGFLAGWLIGLLDALGAIPLPLRVDVADAAAVRDAVRSAAPSLVLHLAAPVDVRRDPALRPAMQRVIVDGTRHVVAACAAAGAALLHVGTCEEYGAIEAPFREDAAVGAPVSPYAEAKLAATALVRAQRDVPAVVARPFLTYGAGQRARQLVPQAASAALAGRPFPMTAGTWTREWNHASDTAAGLLRAADCTRALGEIVNVGCGEEHRVVDLVGRIFALAGADRAAIQAGALPTRPGEVPRFCADVTRCRSWLRHRPAVPLDDGLRHTLAWLRGTA